jgi:hypothetical protein
MELEFAKKQGKFSNLLETLVVFVMIESISIYFLDLKFEFIDRICEGKISK